MKANIQKTLLLASVFVFIATFAMGQKVFKGTIYRDGEPAAGVNVEVHKGESMMTSFDGKYEVKGDEKSKWIRFTFIDESEKVDIPENSDGVINFAFDGNIPEEGNSAAPTGGVSMKSQEELVKEQNQDYINEFSLYSEFYKQDDYKSALPHWKKIYNSFPKSSPNVYIQGIKMYQSLIENASTKEEKNKFIDELMKIYDKRIENFGEKGYVLGRKGTDWLKYKLTEQDLGAEEQKAVIKSGYEWLSQSVELQGNNTEAPVLVLLMQTSKSLLKLGELSKETVIKNYEKSSSIINEVIGSNSDADRVTRMEKIQPNVETIFGTSGAADCETLVNIYTPQFKEKSNDIEFIKSMLLKLGRADCDESELFAEATEKLYELEPSALAAYNMARRFVKRNDFEKAKEYYKEAMDQETDQELLATYYLQFAKVLYSQTSYSEARNYARKVLSIQPDNCEANMLIGEIYAHSSTTFNGSKLEKDAIFWLAVDYYAKARSGEDCSIDAAQKIATYRAYFPNKEDAFMEGLQEGQSYKIGGWINESTKVRFTK